MSPTADTDLFLHFGKSRLEMFPASTAVNILNHYQIKVFSAILFLKIVTSQEAFGSGTRVSFWPVSAARDKWTGEATVWLRHKGLVLSS